MMNWSQTDQKGEKLEADKKVLILKHILSGLNMLDYFKWFQRFKKKQSFLPEHLSAQNHKNKNMKSLFSTPHTTL